MTLADERIEEIEAAVKAATASLHGLGQSERLREQGKRDAAKDLIVAAIPELLAEREELKREIERLEKDKGRLLAETHDGSGGVVAALSNSMIDELRTRAETAESENAALRRMLKPWFKTDKELKDRLDMELRAILSNECVTLRDLAIMLKETMPCNCDLNRWEPEKSTGHSFVCRIHKEATRLHAILSKKASE